MKTLDQQKNVSKPFDDVFMSKAYSEFFTGWHQIFSLHLFKRSFFSAELIGSKLRNKNMALGGSRVMLPRKFFENLDTIMAVLVLFEQFSRQTFYFFTPNSESFIKYNVFYYKQYSQDTAKNTWADVSAHIWCHCQR